jgi:hypothetical protein
LDGADWWNGRAGCHPKLEHPAVHDTVKTNVFGFRNYNFSCDIQRYVWNGLAYDELSGKKDR